jgi:CRISPR-associated protein Cmr3
MSSPKPFYYTITLTPEDRFFFGGELAFGQAGDKERRRSYLIRSRVLPQQTSLLGMLRYELLRHHDCLAPYYAKDKRKEEATILVGETGFRMGDVDAYGTIEALSPLLLSDGEHLWVPRPLDDAEGKDRDKDDAPTNCQWQRKAGRYWQLQHYNPKDELVTHFVRADGTVERKLDDCFSKVTVTGNRVSNRLARPGETSEENEEGLFRQTFRKNANSEYNGKQTEERVPTFSFVFRVCTHGDQFGDFVNEEQVGEATGGTQGRAARVFLGGERSTFLMQVERADDLDLVPTPIYRRNRQLLDPAERIVFTSDVLLPAEVKTIIDADHRYLLLAHTKSFRFLKTNLNRVRQFASLAPSSWRGAIAEDGAQTTEAPKQTGRRTESHPYQLLERGGVLIVPPGKGKDIVAQIQAIEDLHRIGYNHCAVAVSSPNPEEE